MKRRTRIRIAVILGIVLLAVCGPVVFLSLANPQWSRFIYLWQCHIYPKHAEGEIKPPPGFTGTWKTWWRSGRKRAEYQYLNGEYDGTQWCWFPNGQPADVVSFKNGKFHGERRQWYESGQPCSKAFFIQGKVDGEATHWHKNGKISRQQYFKNGVPVGEWVLYDENGKVLIKRKQEKGNEKGFGK